MIKIFNYGSWQLNKYKLCKHRANLATKVHFIATLTQSNNEDVEIYYTNRKIPIAYQGTHYPPYFTQWFLKVAAGGEPDLNCCFCDSNGGTEHRTFDILQEN